MRKITAIVFLVISVACGRDLKTHVEKLEKENKLLKDMAGPLPSSLNNFYPPSTQSPIYQIDMLNLATHFDGIGVDLQENDLAGAIVNFNTFKAQYQKMSGMIPEWVQIFPIAPVDTLGRALERGDPKLIGMAMSQVGDVCTYCHMISQTKAHQKYHWPDFDNLKITDPVSGEELSWHDYMMRMSGAYSGIATNLQQGQLENALSCFKAFSNQFNSMSEACFDCHYTTRNYYTDANIQEIINELGMALSSSSPDANAIEQLGVSIGNEACLKCHYVHMPAVMAKQQWRYFEEMFK